MKQPENNKDEWIKIALEAAGALQKDTHEGDRILIKGRTDVGKEIFRTHNAAGCMRCHKIGGEGGIIGPALDGIADRKDRDYIYRALVNPTSEIAEGFDRGNASPMVPMKFILNEQELSDIMAYLLTLHKPLKNGK